jgi:ankyrin repeat protein
MARLLLELKADLDKPSANGTTAMIDAIVSNHIELAMFLLDKGANPNAADNFYKRTPRPRSRAKSGLCPRHRTTGGGRRDPAI